MNQCWKKVVPEVEVVLYAYQGFDLELPDSRGLVEGNWYGNTDRLDFYLKWNPVVYILFKP